MKPKIKPPFAAVSVDAADLPTCVSLALAHLTKLDAFNSLLILLISA